MKKHGLNKEEKKQAKAKRTLRKNKRNIWQAKEG